MAVMEKCGDCRFFDKQEKECRRNAPTAFVTPVPPSALVKGMAPQGGGMSIVGIWPSTRDVLWCGQFELKRGIQ